MQMQAETKKSKTLEKENRCYENRITMQLFKRNSHLRTICCYAMQHK